MKNLFITLFIFITLTVKSQKQFEGVWKSDSSTYKTTIISSKYAILKVFNFSFKEDYCIEENIINQTDTGFVTTLYNPRNGYKVTIEYKFIKNVLTCKFSGDYNGLVKLTKILSNE